MRPDDPIAPSDRRATILPGFPELVADAAPGPAPGLFMAAMKQLQRNGAAPQFQAPPPPAASPEPPPRPRRPLPSPRLQALRGGALLRVGNQGADLLRQVGQGRITPGQAQANFNALTERSDFSPNTTTQMRGGFAANLTKVARRGQSRQPPARTTPQTAGLANEESLPSVAQPAQPASQAALATPSQPPSGFKDLIVAAPKRLGEVRGNTPLGKLDQMLSIAPGRFNLDAVLDEIEQFKVEHPIRPETGIGNPVASFTNLANQTAKLKFFLNQFPGKQEFDRTFDARWNYKLLDREEFEDFGNFMFGFLGTKLGIDPLTLQIGAGVFQQGKLRLLFDGVEMIPNSRGMAIPNAKFFENLKSYFSNLGDDPKDVPFVSDGIAAAKVFQRPAKLPVR